jgi:hypothetical protein
MLANSLGGSVSLAHYTSDGFLIRIYAHGDLTETRFETIRVGGKIPKYQQRYVSEPARLWTVISALVRQADAYAATNRDAWLAEECERIAKTEGFKEASYETSSDAAVMTITSEQGYAVGNRGEEFLYGWQTAAKNYTLFLGTDVEIIFVAPDGVTVEHSVFAERQDYCSGGNRSSWENLQEQMLKEPSTSGHYIMPRTIPPRSISRGTKVGIPVSPAPEEVPEN